MTTQLPNLSLTLNTEKDLIATDVPSQRVLEVVIQAPTALTVRPRARLNLALVIDRSGSMNGEKLDYVKQAAAHVLDLLSEQDRVALVAYDDRITLLSSSIAVTREARYDLKERIQSLRAGNMTNLSGGWLTGCQEVAQQQEQGGAEAEGRVNRTLLLTDGLANEGITDSEQLSRHASELSSRGVSTSTFGVGQGFNEHLLEAISNQGGGNFYYIAYPSEIPGIFQREFNELSAVTLRGVTLTLEVPAKVDVQVLGGWRCEREGRKLAVHLGDLQSGRVQELYLNLLLPPSRKAEKLELEAKLSGLREDGRPEEARTSQVFTYAAGAEVDAAAPRRDVMERSAKVRMSEAANEALKRERAGDAQGASRALDIAVAACAPMMAPDEVEKYEHLSKRMREGISESERKEAHYHSYLNRRRREE